MLRPDKFLSVLIVDPSEAATPVLKRMLAELGIGMVDSVTNGVDALTRLREGEISLLMTDWRMEPMGGGELLRSIQIDPKLSSTAVMVVTAAPDPDQFFDALDYGVDAYAVAPFSTRILAAKLAAIPEDR
jgi:two-component system chemotaxis response regulator CheY